MRHSPEKWTSWSRWHHRGESALADTEGRIRVLFGMGPRHTQRSPEDRVELLCQHLSPGLAAVRWCQQVHGRLLATLSSEHEPLRGAACVGRCDGLMTDEVGLGLLVWTADCVPIVLIGGGVICAVHSGWRGSAAGVVTSAVRRLKVEYGVPAEKVTAILGPAVGPCHYEVGAEVIESLAAVGVPSRSWLDGDRVDLRRLIIGQLGLCGVPTGNIHLVGGCTACSEELASYRRDGEQAGRQWSLVYQVI